MAWQRSFRPLTGMVLELQSIWTAADCFRPLTGMVHEQEMADARVRCFRPLTGMVLIPFYVDEVLPGFSPPYGDGTFQVRRPDSGNVFAPLRGWYWR